MLNLSAYICLYPSGKKPVGSSSVFNKSKSLFSPGSCQQWELHPSNYLLLNLEEIELFIVCVSCSLLEHFCPSRNGLIAVNRELIWS